MHPFSNAWCVATSGTLPVSPCPQQPAHHTLSTPGALIGFAVKTAAVNSRNIRSLTCPNRDSTSVRTVNPHINRKPTGDCSPMGCVEPPSSQLSLLVAATMSAKIKMKSWKADVAPAAAVMAGTMPGVVTPVVGGTVVRTMPTVAGTVSMTRVVMTGTAPVMSRAMTASMTGTAGVMMVSRLHRGRCEDGKTGGDCQESDELFHDAWGLGLSRCRQRAACKSDERPPRLFNRTALFYEH